MEKSSQIFRQEAASFSRHSDVDANQQPSLVSLGNWSEIKGKEAWGTWISNNLLEFKGNQENAGQLLHSFVDGAKTMYTILQKGGHTNFNLPRISISTANDDSLSDIGYNISEGYIRIKKSYLEEGSLESMSKISLFPNQDSNGNDIDDEILFDGNYPGRLFFSGVEECHHAWHFQEGGQPPIFNAAESGYSLAAYDAQPHELDALKAQLAIAKDKKLKGATNVFTDRIEKAEEYLKNH